MKSFLTLLLLKAVLTHGALVPRGDSSPDYSAIAAQPQPTITGPTVGSSQQTNVPADGQASSSGSAAAGSTAASKRNFCWGWRCPPPPKPEKSSPAPYPTGTSAGPKYTTPGKPDQNTPMAYTSVASSTSSLSSWVQPSTCTSTPYTPHYPALSTTASGTGYSGAGSPTSSTSTACPTTPEAGTFCGFINPEDACAPQPDGYGPVPTPDTAAAFLVYQPFHQAARSVKTPAGFSEIFQDLNASVSAANFLGLKTLSSYSVDQCAQACQCTELCSSFNLFVERDPSLNPSDNCTNPASITSYKCTLWGGPISASDATNAGQFRGQFEVVITGSNGYVAAPEVAPPAPQPGWGHGKHCSGGGISDGHHHMGGHFFPGSFDPRICAAYADAQTSANHDACAPGGSYQACNLWNAYALKKDGKYWGMYCVLFTDHPSNSNDEYGSYTGGTYDGSVWSVDWSWSQSHSSDTWDHGVKPRY